MSTNEQTKPPFDKNHWIRAKRAPISSLGGIFGAETVPDLKPRKALDCWFWQEGGGWLVLLDGIEGIFQADAFDLAEDPENVSEFTHPQD